MKKQQYDSKILENAMHLYNEKWSKYDIYLIPLATVLLFICFSLFLFKCNLYVGILNFVWVALGILFFSRFDDKAINVISIMLTFPIFIWLTLVVFILGMLKYFCSPTLAKIRKSKLKNASKF